jgi:quercetin dioxygenase-like cupin family protein/DNA-binding XRE family transcriptional regulator
VPVAVLQIGGRIRAERLKREVSLRSLARSVGLSPSLISQIETGKCQPSVSTLYAITTALGVSVQEVLGEAPAGARAAEAAPVALAPAGAAGVPAGGPGAGGPAGTAGSETGTAGSQTGTAGSQAGTANGLGASPGVGERPGSRGPVVCPAQREILEFDSGVTWERLGRVPGSRVDFLLVRYAPGGCSSEAGRLMEHPGTEYGYLTEGELVVTLGFRSHRLAAGDAVSFASATPHSYRNEGPGPAVGIWFVAEPGGP